MSEIAVQLPYQISTEQMRGWAEYHSGREADHVMGNSGQKRRVATKRPFSNVAANPLHERTTICGRCRRSTVANVEDEGVQNRVAEIRDLVESESTRPSCLRVINIHLSTEGWVMQEEESVSQIFDTRQHELRRGVRAALVGIKQSVKVLTIGVGRNANRSPWLQ